MRRTALAALTAIAMVVGAAAPSTARPRATGLRRVLTRIVSMRGLSFVPAVLVIRRGTPVRWNNDSNDGHNVVIPAAGFDSNPGCTSSNMPACLPPAGHVTYTFKSSGVYAYYCTPHLVFGMVGLVLVT